MQEFVLFQRSSCEYTYKFMQEFVFLKDHPVKIQLDHSNLFFLVPNIDVNL